MHESAFARKRRSTELAVCFRGQARIRKPSNPYWHRSAKAELWMSGKTRIRFPGSVEIRRYGFP
ncbi:hypothetical protein E7Z57_03470 [Ralstonia pseudosolanacearum]|uniref:Uncharacterized protein n=1 Tax=Ralstonia solanacearum TaxID=305 RepID=A0AA92EAE5_RALSL|nr:hypothetical protein E7Z57_03470 [Ralstonia pseudosolanacearum]